jgi:DNA polymerase I-like protein with 3'-5' exonuclease and polymerase domains
VYFSSVDYDSFELKSVAQVCLWTVGRSHLATVLNEEGRCPHTELGASIARLSKAEAYKLVKDKSSNFKATFRQTAKIGNFGYPGGMGPKTLRVQARAQYKVHLSLEQCVALRDAWRVEWPEFTEYFAWINSQMRGEREKARGTFRHFKSNRIRANCPYTVGCNTLFQGLAADAAKAAGFQLAKEMYVVPSSPLFGCRPVIFAHDEFVIEVPEHPERAHAAAYRQAEVMCNVAQEYMPDLRITAKPALSRRYTKLAETKHNAQGLLIPYEDAA